MKKIILILIVFLININYINAEELTCTTTLKKGIKGDIVKTLQVKLNEVMDCNLSVDGIYGSKTKTCVLKFQEQNGLNETGTVNKTTCKTLNEFNNNSTSNVPLNEDTSMNLKKGSTGDLVKEIQTNLNKVSSCSLKIDGIYGSKTKTCVIKFQNENDLPDTGSVDEVTYNKIVELSSDSTCGTTLEKGSTGEMVKYLQTRLNEVTNCNLEIDGIYGNLTKSCVMKYQRSTNLEVTGTFNSTTCHKLKNQDSKIEEETPLKTYGKSIIVTGNKVNIRKSKSTSSKILKKVVLGDILEYIKTETKNDTTWYKVKINDDYGYIQGNYVSKNFIVVDISQQKLVLYKNDQEILNTEVVTGTYGTHDTPTGSYTLKVNNLVKGKTLRGYNPDGSLDYATYVDYWMPFITDRGIGFHDASWRGNGEYTDTRYLYDGSHGCVNMKSNDAKTLFTNIDKNIKVIVRD